MQHDSVRACGSYHQQPESGVATHYGSMLKLIISFLQAVEAMCKMLPPPVVIKHVLQPFLLSLPHGPHIALGLANLAAAIDSHALAIELLPSLVAVLTTPADMAGHSSAAQVDATGGLRGEAPLGMFEGTSHQPCRLLHWQAICNADE